MHTNHAETRSISIAAPPATVLDYVGDPRHLPEWAPAFARGVRADGDQWLVDSGEGQLRILVRVSPEHGTVDLLSADDPTRGAFTRVVHNSGGSEYLFTLFGEVNVTTMDDALVLQEGSTWRILPSANGAD